MAVRLVCRACGKRLKLPDAAVGKRSAKCPKCLAPVDLTAAMEASAYLPTVTVPGSATASGRNPPALLGEDDPLPYPDPKPVPPLPPKPTRPAPPPLPSSQSRSPLAEPENGAPAALPSAPLPLDDDLPLSLDDDPAPDGSSPEPEPPFRVPVRVLADSLRQIAGPCFAVLVPHGMFLEREPMQPFLYVPVKTAAESAAPGELTVTLPDGRAVTFRFTSRYARPLARATVAFLADARPVPVAADYRRKWWMLWAALIFALGLAAGPLVLSQIADLGWEFGLQVGAGFALAGLFANTAVAIFSRRSIPGQLAAMAGVCVLVTGLFLFGATAYLAGRHKAAEEAKAEPPPVAPPTDQTPPPPPVTTPPEPPPERAPTHLDRAKKPGVGASALEDGPADVTALALAPDNNTLGIGHADGTVRLWLLDQPTFEAFLPGPKADAPVSRIQFDAKNNFVFAHTPTGVVAAPRTGPSMLVAKIPGSVVAVAPEWVGERIKFSAVRGNTIQTRLLAATFLQNPPEPQGKAAPYAIPTPGPKGDESVPQGNAADPPKPGGGAGPTFLAWTPSNRLFAGQPNGTISIWTVAMRPEAPANDHKGPVRAWATCAATGNFATGDDRGQVAFWPLNKGGKPVVSTVLATPITGLSFNPSGSRLAVTDSTGWVVIWDVPGGKALYRVKRSTAAKAMAYGPTDDVILLATGKTVEVWWVPEFVK